MLNEKLLLLSEETIHKATSRKCKNTDDAMDHAMGVVAAEGIAEPEYAAIFEIQCKTSSHSGLELICGGQYHYDKNGILRKLYRHRSDISYPMERLDIGTDCYFYDDKGRVIRALINGTYGSDAEDDAQFYRLTYRYESNSCDVAPFWGNLEVIGFVFQENTCIPKEIIPDACDDIYDFDIREDFPKNPLLSCWDVAAGAADQKTDLPSRGFPPDEPSDKPIYNYRIIKASPETEKKLTLCFEERKRRHL